MKFEVVYESKRLDRALKRLPCHLNDAFLEVVRLLEEPNPPPKLHYEKLQANDAWRSVRLDADSGYRVIFYEDGNYRVIAWVDAHDDAYRWAKQNHPRYNDYGEFEIFSEEIPPPPEPAHTTPELLDTSQYPFAPYETKDLIKLGVPNEQWANYLKQLDAQSLKAELTRMSQEGLINENAALRLDLLSEGGDIRSLMPPAQLNLLVDAMLQNSLRRGVLWRPEDWHELENYLQHPWERWLVFLNPTQRESATRQFAGPARVTGGPGTGKTVVALHRAKALVKRYAPQRVFLTTYTTSLAQELQRRARLLISANDLATLRIQNLDKYVQEEIQRFCPGTQIIYKEQQLQTITRFDELCTQRGIFGPHRMLVWDEWQQVIDAWNIRSESEYLEFERVGRRYALQSGQRRTYWAIFEQMRQYLRNAYCMTPAMACYELAQRLRSRPPFRCVIADEAQDFGPAQMCLLQSLAPPDQPDNLFLCVDVAQRIYTRSVPWIRYGIDVRGRSHRLRINYRNTREIQETAERVLTPEMQIQQAQALDDPDALQERIASGWRPVPVLCNPDVPPVLRPCRSRVEEAEQLLQWIRECHANNIQYDEIAVVARTKDVLNEIIAEVLRELGITACECGQVATPEQIYADTAHAVKGLEFRAVAIVAADLFPLVVRERHIAEDYEQRERNLLFTAMTRPRERLYISWSGKLPEFLGQVTL